MLWYKSWLETRSRFLLGLVLLMCSAAGVVFTYPRVMELLPLVPSVEVSGEIARRIREAAELSRSYRGYIWSSWFNQNMMTLWGLFAILLGTGSVVSAASGGGTLFTLSLPVTRSRLAGVRAAMGLGELLIMAFVPSLLLLMFSPAIGQSYAITDALIHSACMFIAGGVFFSLAFLLSTFFADIWRPLGLAFLLPAALVLIEQILRQPRFHETLTYSFFGIMSGASYFRGDGLPWLGLLVTSSISAALLYAAVRNFERQDF